MIPELWLHFGFLFVRHCLLSCHMFLLVQTPSHKNSCRRNLTYEQHEAKHVRESTWAKGDETWTSKYAKYFSTQHPNSKTHWSNKWTTEGENIWGWASTYYKREIRKGWKVIAGATLWTTAPLTCRIQDSSSHLFTPSHAHQFNVFPNPCYSLFLIAFIITFIHPITCRSIQCVPKPLLQFLPHHIYSSQNKKNNSICSQILITVSIWVPALDNITHISILFPKKHCLWGKTTYQYY